MYIEDTKIFEKKRKWTEDPLTNNKKIQPGYISLPMFLNRRLDTYEVKTW